MNTSAFPDSQSHIGTTINDYSMIKKIDEKTNRLVPIDIPDTNNWNSESVKFIQKEISITDGLTKCIVLTHHAPLFSNKSENLLTCNEQYIDSTNKYAFHNDLVSLFVKPIRVWIYGHTHYASKAKYNDIILATNQLGYAHEENNIKFNSYAWIDLSLI